MTTFGKFITFLIIVLLGGGIYFFFTHRKAEVPAVAFKVNGQAIALIGGIAEAESAPGSASKTITKYFGNDVVGDFDNDGVEDRAFLVTQTTGGSGIFYYLATTNGGEAAYLGDRIAPQTDEYRNGEIIVNYADRKKDEPMTASPSIGVSKYFKVENNDVIEISHDSTVGNATTTEVSGSVTGTVTISPTCPVERTPADPNCAPKVFVTEVTAFEKLSQEMVAHAMTSDKGIYTLKLPTGDYTIHASTTGTYPRCTDQDVSIKTESVVTLAISCDSGIR